METIEKKSFNRIMAEWSQRAAAYKPTPWDDVESRREPLIQKPTRLWENKKWSAFNDD